MMSELLTLSSKLPLPPNLRQQGKMVKQYWWEGRIGQLAVNVQIWAHWEAMNILVRRPQDDMSLLVGFLWFLSRHPDNRYSNVLWIFIHFPRRKGMHVLQHCREGSSVVASPIPPLGRPSHLGPGIASTRRRDPSCTIISPNVAALFLGPNNHMAG